MNLASLAFLLLSATMLPAPPPGAAPSFSWPADEDAPIPAAEDGAVENAFAPSLFEFKVTLPDDGKGEAGGTQTATATLTFTDMRPNPAKTWTCPVKVEVAIRTKEKGKIEPDQAARTTARVATDASKAVLPSEPEWPVTIKFCIKWRAEMLTIFKKKYGWYGARVTAS